MKISTRGRYAVRVMVELAAYDNGEYIKVRQIAKRQDISEKYLEQIISILNKAGYLLSSRGAQGGYKLKYDPSYYTVGMILRQTEGSLSPVPCSSGGGDGCSRCDICDTKAVWQELEEAIQAVVEKYTIADLLKRRQERIGGEYVI